MSEPNQSLLPWLENNGVLAASIAAVIAIVVPYLIARFGVSSLKDEVQDRASHPKLIERYRESGAHAYFHAIEALLRWADRFYGKRLLGGAAVARTVQLAFLYPPAALLIGWVVFDSASLGGFDVLPIGISWAGRVWRSALLLSIATGLYF